MGGILDARTGRWLGATPADLIMLKVCTLFGYACFVGMAFSALALQYDMLGDRFLIDLFGLAGLISVTTGLAAGFLLDE